jgi:hypothetical protein
VNSIAHYPLLFDFPRPKHVHDITNLPKPLANAASPLVPKGCGQNQIFLPIQAKSTSATTFQRLVDGGFETFLPHLESVLKSRDTHLGTIKLTVPIFFREISLSPGEEGLANDGKNWA